MKRECRSDNHKVKANCGSWNEQSSKHKIAESFGSDSNEFDQYLFAVRDRIGTATIQRAC